MMMTATRVRAPSVVVPQEVPSVDSLMAYLPLARKVVFNSEIYPGDRHRQLIVEFDDRKEWFRVLNRWFTFGATSPLHISIESPKWYLSERDEADAITAVLMGNAGRSIEELKKFACRMRHAKTRDTLRRMMSSGSTSRIEAFFDLARSIDRATR